MKTLMEILIENGYPREQMYNHETDLYIFANALANKSIDQWCKETGFKRYLFVSTFRDNLTGKLMYDCAFQYTPEWERKCGGDKYGTDK